MQLTVKELKEFLKDKPDGAFVVLQEKYEALPPVDSNDYDDYAGLPTGDPQHIYNVQFYEGMVWLI